MPAKKQESHWFNVAILSYNSPKTRAMAQRGEAISGRIRVEVTYSGSSWRDARHALGLAIVRANRLRLSYAVHVLRDYERIILVHVEHL